MEFLSDRLGNAAVSVVTRRDFGGRRETTQLNQNVPSFWFFFWLDKYEKKYIMRMKMEI
jgi:hypothetical protein